MENKIKKIYKRKTGFTLVELLAVIGIFSIVASVAAVSLNGTRSQAVLEEAEATIIQALGQAQNRAMTGVGSTAHGVHIEERRIVTFEGDTYVEGEGEETLLPLSVSTDQSDATVIFNRINAKPNISIVIVLTHISGATKTITITGDGVVLID